MHPLLFISCLNAESFSNAESRPRCPICSQRNHSYFRNGIFMILEEKVIMFPESQKERKLKSHFTCDIPSCNDWKEILCQKDFCLKKKDV